MTSFESVVGDLDYMVREVDRQRGLVSSAKREVGRIEMEIAAQFGPRLALARALLNQTKQELKELEAQTRLDGLEKWEQDPSHKRPHPAIGIRVNKAVALDLDLALAYAIARGKWLKLDLVPFKKDAKLALSMSEPDAELATFAEIVEKPAATIATDLSKYLDDPDVE